MLTSSFDALLPAWEALDETGAPFLLDWRDQVARARPYSGLRVYHNIPLSIEAVCKIDTLCQAGAEVVVSCTDFLIPATLPQARRLIDAAGIEFRENKYAQPGEFDFYLDCSAELSVLPPPKRGVIELTRTGALVYEKKHFAVPILSVDNSYLKILETYYGTGEAFLRAFRALSGKNVSDETFLLFGYGKVGQGVAQAIRKAGGECQVIEIEPRARSLAKQHGFRSFVNDAEGLVAVDGATVVVTATGRKEILRRSFPTIESHLAGKTLCNIGADDEIGMGFTGVHLLAGGHPINFSLEHPTLMKYLDPSLYAHNLGIQVLQEREYAPGFHPFPRELDLSIVHRWADIHNESIDLIIRTQ